MPFHRILIPTDFSTAAEWVFDDAIRIAESGDAELVILHVRRTRNSHPDELRFPADPSLYEYAEQQELERLRHHVRRANASLRTRMVVRQAPVPGDEIARVAREIGADLIVIATHGSHHVAHLFVGSTTMAVLKDPPAPVLAIRYGIRKRASFTRVIVPVHAGQSSHRALELARREAKEVHLVTVCPEEERGDAETLLRQLAGTTPGMKTAVVQGKNPEEEILRYASKCDADAIFINSAAEPSERKLDIVRHATIPVMVV